MESRWITLLLVAGFAVGLVFFITYFRRLLRAYGQEQQAGTEQAKQQAAEERWSSSRGMIATAFCLLAYVLILGKYLTTTLE